MFQLFCRRDFVEDGKSSFGHVFFSFLLPSRIDGNSNNTSNIDADKWSHNSPSASVNMPNIFPQAYVPMSPVIGNSFQQRQNETPTSSPMISSTPGRNQHSSAPSNFNHLQQMVTDSDDDTESSEDGAGLLTQSTENISSWLIAPRVDIFCGLSDSVKLEICSFGKSTSFGIQ